MSAGFTETVQPSQTSRLLDFVESLSSDALSSDLQAAARDHLVDTFGVIVAGMNGEIVRSMAEVLSVSSEPGGIPLPGSGWSASWPAFAMLCGTAAHGIELDDGYRQGTVHPGVSVVPALLALAGRRHLGGRQFLTAMVAGYEVICAVSEAGHPALRQRGYHPTSATGPLGAACAAAVLAGMDRKGIERALGHAASACGGLFAFLVGGGDVKRLHGGLAARGGLEAALHAEAGISAPADIFDIPSGWAHTFTGGPIELCFPPHGGFRLPQCYFKPYACCRHLQPAFEATVELMARHELVAKDIIGIEVDTYEISARHADVSWDSLASAQLSFPYLIALAINRGKASLADFDDATRATPWVQEVAGKLTVRVDAEIDSRYPAERPSRVTLVTDKGRYQGELSEALGSAEFPMTEQDIRDKFLSLTAPVLGDARAASLLDMVWNIGQCTDVAEVLDASRI